MFTIRRILVTDCNLGVSQSEIQQSIIKVPIPYIYIFMPTPHILLEFV